MCTLHFLANSRPYQSELRHACAPSHLPPVCGALQGRTKSGQNQVNQAMSCPTSSDKAQADFRLGAHTLPIEQGRIGRSKAPRHSRTCTICTTNAVGNKPHCVFDCPQFGDHRQQHAKQFQDFHGAMKCFMWHKDHKSDLAFAGQIS